MTSEQQLERKPEASAHKSSGIEARWATYTAMGSFLLYLLGYLVLRFHLTALGVETDLAVLDERYFFAGAQFLVYFFSAVPICLLLLLPVVLPAYFLRKYWWGRFERWSAHPTRLLLVGILWSVGVIQLVERQCLPFTNLLLRQDLPEPAWVQAVLLDPRGGIESLYFSFLLSALTVTGGLWYLAWRRGLSIRQPTMVLLAALGLIQLLLLPVNFGLLIANKEVARVSMLTGKEPLQAGEQAWRLWEGKDTVSFLLQQGKTRKIVAIDRKEIQRTEVVQYDPLLQLLHSANP